MGDSQAERRTYRPPQSRTSAILDAVRQHIEARRNLWDGSNELAEVQITVTLQAGGGDTAVIRSVKVSEERIVRRA